MTNIAKKYPHYSEKERLWNSATEKEKAFARKHQSCWREIVSRFYQFINDDYPRESTWLGFLFAVQPKKGEKAIVSDAFTAFVLKRDLPSEILPTDFTRIFKEVKHFPAEG